MLEEAGSAFVGKQRKHSLALGLIEAIVQFRLVGGVHRGEQLGGGFGVIAGQELFDPVRHGRGFRFGGHDGYL